jgi:excisionase family DNA binding protein
VSRRLPPEEAADYLGVTEAWVRRAIKDRVIPFHKVGHYVRFDTTDLDAYLQANRVEAEVKP